MVSALTIHFRWRSTGAEHFRWVLFLELSTGVARKAWKRHFGDNTTAWREDVCIFGFEPNPGHSARLRELSNRYTSRGWRTTYIIGGAGGANQTSLYLPRTQNDLEMAGTVKHDCRPTAPTADSNGPDQERDIKKGSKNVGTNVPVFEFGHFIVNHIMLRRSPPGSVVAKVDVEGSEWAIFENLLAKAQADSSIIEAINEYVVEFHGAAQNQQLKSYLDT